MKQRLPDAEQLEPRKGGQIKDDKTFDYLFTVPAILS